MKREHDGTPGSEFTTETRRRATLLLEHVQGHQCWVGGRDRVIATTHRRAAADQP
jgi:hypothetical protein